jgi:hypothetical protein
MSSFVSSTVKSGPEVVIVGVLGVKVRSVGFLGVVIRSVGGLIGCEGVTSSLGCLFLDDFRKLPLCPSKVQSLDSILPLQYAEFSTLTISSEARQYGQLRSVCLSGLLTRFSKYRHLSRPIEVRPDRLPVAGVVASIGASTDTRSGCLSFQNLLGAVDVVLSASVSKSMSRTRVLGGYSNVQSLE